MLMLKVQCNILKSTKSEGSRVSYVQMFHYLQFHMERRKCLWTFSWDICTDPYVNLTFRVIWAHPQILSNVNTLIKGWNNTRSTSEALNLQQWFGLIFLCVFKIKPCLVFSCMCRRCIFCYRRNIIITICRSKDELIIHLLASVLDG